MNVDNKAVNVKTTEILGGQTRIACPPALARNVDKLKVSFWVNWQNSSFLDELAEIKSSLQNTDNLQEKPYYCPGGFNWNVNRTGTRLFTFRLTSGDLTFLLNTRSSQDKIPNTSFEIGSESCWAPGFEELFYRFSRWIEVLDGSIVKNQISEVHLAADFIGTKISDLNIADRDYWITRSQLFTTYLTNYQLSSIAIGKGDIMLRIYDKVLELRHNAAKQLTFAEAWGLPRFDVQPVTRAEFQLRRPVLKTIKPEEQSETGIDTFTDLCESFQSIWTYCTLSWARHCSEKIEHDQNHQSRANPSKFWAELSSIKWEGNEIRARQRPMPKKDYIALRKQYIGIAMSLAAFHDIHGTDPDHIIEIGKHILDEDIIAFYLSDEPEFTRRLEKKKREIYESVSTLHSMKPEHPDEGLYPAPYPPIDLEKEHHAR